MKNVYLLFGELENRSAFWKYLHFLIKCNDIFDFYSFCLGQVRIPLGG
jgi:hypothetical protein